MLVVTMPDFESNKSYAESDQLQHGAQQACDLLKAIATPTRMMLLCALMMGEMTVTELCYAVGTKQSLTSHHLNRLRLSGLVATRRNEKFIYYRLADDVAKLIVGVLYERYCGNAGEDKPAAA